MSALLRWALAGSFLFIFGVAARGADEKGVKVGDPAPSFKATDDQGKPWDSADHVSKKIVVVYFFPAALTGG
jgi:peroxiredoxin Q/BCP